jgi:type I restriction enzyme S subunit
MSAEVKPGYKMTEVGVIPEDWEVASIASVTPPHIKNGIVDGPFGSNLKTIHYRTSGIPIITSGYVTDGKFYAEKYLYVDQQKFKDEKRSAVHAGDIVMAKIGERCGASAILPENHDIGILSGNALKITVDLSKHSTFYVWQVLWDLYSSGKIELLKTIGAQPAISMANLKKHLIPLPSTKFEQEAIAEALSDADALIESLEQLIAKKRQIKKGTMQELLNPKAGWEKVKLGSLGVFLKGSGIKRYESLSGNIPCIRYGEIYTKHKDYIKAFDSWISPEVAATATRIKCGDILFAGSGETKEEIGKCVAFVDDIDAYAGGDIVILRPNNANPLFLGCYLNTESVNRQKASKGQGDAVVHIGSNALADIDLIIPPVDEQAVVASVLFDMDAEIGALEAKLKKNRQIKQGMMHNLLTGKIRMV